MTELTAPMLLRAVAATSLLGALPLDDLAQRTAVFTQISNEARLLASSASVLASRDTDGRDLASVVFTNANHLQKSAVEGQVTLKALDEASRFVARAAHASAAASALISAGVKLGPEHAAILCVGLWSQFSDWEDPALLALGRIATLFEVAELIGWDSTYARVSEQLDVETAALVVAVAKQNPHETLTEVRLACLSVC